MVQWRVQRRLQPDHEGHRKMLMWRLSWVADSDAGDITRGGESAGRCCDFHLAAMRQLTSSTQALRSYSMVSCDHCLKYVAECCFHRKYHSRRHRWADRWPRRWYWRCCDVLHEVMLGLQVTIPQRASRRVTATSESCRTSPESPVFSRPASIGKCFTFK